MTLTVPVDDREPRTALEVTVTAPVVSFRNPLFTGVQVTLPCPPPITVGGMLAAAAGGWQHVDPEFTFAMAFHARGGGTDLETYHPLDASGRPTTPAPRLRDFLADITLRVWIFDDQELWRARLRQPRWMLRLGRSQDLVGIRLDHITIDPRAGAQLGAVLPAEVPGNRGTLLRLPVAVSADRGHTRWGSFRFDSTGRAPEPVPGSWSAADGQAIVPIAAPHPDAPAHSRPGPRTETSAHLHGCAGSPSPSNSPAAATPEGTAETPPPALPQALRRLRAKSGSAGRPAESLTAHLEATLTAARRLQRRVGRLEAADTVLAGRFWTAVAWAALTHDAGKVPDGFQDMVNGRTRRWGERHEVLSLGFLPHLIGDKDLLAWVAAAVATHHRPLTGDGTRDLEVLYGPSDLDEVRLRFGPVPDDAVAALLAWLRSTASADNLPVLSETAPVSAAQVTEDAHRLLGELLERWAEGEAPDGQGLTCVLLQGAVTLADHLSSAHRDLDHRQPFDARLKPRVEQHLAARGGTLRRHQQQADDTHGHLLLRAPTGSGKTEAALLWAATQVGDLTETTGGVPRTFYTLPYLASINAMTTRLSTLLGDDTVVGVTHSRAASYHLARAIAPDDGHDSDSGDGAGRVTAAAKAVSRAAATRHFQETVRVGTPYQLLRAALAGTAHSGTLVDAANSVFILDELHAYDERRLGYLLASARLWEQLGGRIAVLSATLPDALAEVFTSTLDGDTIPVREENTNQPARHRLRTRSHRLTEPPTLEEIRARLRADQSVLVVANNVAHALELLDALAPDVIERHGPEAALLLHSRFKRGDRSAIENRITARYGTHGKRRPGLLVATQAVEVSLDVDFDVLFTAAAPLEALLQRFGRINRIAARPPADVIVHAPAWTARRGAPGEYADGIYPREPVQAAWDILLRHDGTVVDEADATGWLNDIYDSDWGRNWRKEVMRHRSTFTEQLLTFDDPYDDRERLSTTFDQLFDGTEAVLTEDIDAYQKALDLAQGQAGRLLADEYLIPMPHWAAGLTRYEKKLKIRIIDGVYDPHRGLLSVSGPAQQTYRAGEVL